MLAEQYGIALPGFSDRTDLRIANYCLTSADAGYYCDHLVLVQPTSKTYLFGVKFPNNRMLTMSKTDGSCFMKYDSNMLETYYDNRD